MEIIGPRPTHSWKDELADIDAETYFINWGTCSTIAQGKEQRLSGMQRDTLPEHYLFVFEQTHKSLLSSGWAPEAAEVVACLHETGQSIGRALREGNVCYAACIYAFSTALYQQGQARKHEMSPRLFSHRIGTASLTSQEPAWERLEVPDRTGFCGLTCSAPVLLSCNPKSFNSSGFRRKETYATGRFTFLNIESDVIAVDSSPDD